VGALADVNLNHTSAPVVHPSTIAFDAQRMVWPDTIGFRQDGSIVVSSNQLNAFYDKTMNFETPVLGTHNFRLETVFAPILAPRFAYNSLPKNADVFWIWHGSAHPCTGVSTAIHVVTNPEECLYSPHNGNSFRMSCDTNFTSGESVASFAHYSGAGCSGTPTYSGVVHGDGRTCLEGGTDPAGKSESFRASCFNEPAEMDEPLKGTHTFIAHGRVDTCDRAPTAVHNVIDGVCTQIINDGHYLKVTCDSDGLALFSTHRSAACTSEDVLMKGQGYGDGRSCLTYSSPHNLRVVLGSAAVLCGEEDASNGGNDGGDKKGGVQTAVAVGLFFVGLAVGSIVMGCCLHYRKKNNAANLQTQDGYHNQLLDE
jgi:hypothetical protein